MNFCFYLVEILLCDFGDVISLRFEWHSRTLRLGVVNNECAGITHTYIADDCRKVIHSAGVSCFVVKSQG